MVVLVEKTTLIVLPSICMPAVFCMAIWAALALPMVTKPKPLLRPVSRSVITLEDSTVPHAENASRCSARRAGARHRGRADVPLTYASIQLENSQARCQWCSVTYQALPTRKLHQQSGFPIPKTLLPLTIKDPRDAGPAARFDLGVEIDKRPLEYFRELAPDRGLAGPHGADKKDIVRGIH